MQESTIRQIRYGFLEGNLEGVPGHVYADAVQAALEAAYPGAEVSVPWQANTSGPGRPAFRPSHPVGFS